MVDYELTAPCWRLGMIQVFGYLIVYVVYISVSVLVSNVIRFEAVALLSRSDQIHYN